LGLTDNRTCLWPSFPSAAINNSAVITRLH